MREITFNLTCRHCGQRYEIYPDDMRYPMNTYCGSDCQYKHEVEPEILRQEKAEEAKANKQML